MTARLLLFVPCYNCEAQIGRVLRQLSDVPEGTFAEVLVVDNRSHDGTVDAASAALPAVGAVRARVVRNQDNYGLGGSHKAAFAYARANGHTHVVVLHGDDQGSIHDALPLLRRGAHLKSDACLGARFMAGSRLIGYSRLRRFGNEVFNLVFSAAVRRRVRDLGSGLNIFAASVFAGDVVHRFPDDLRFNVYLLLSMYDRGLRISYFPISWREEDQISNVRLASQALRTLAAAGQYLLLREHVRLGEHREIPRQTYTFDTLAEHAGRR